MVDLFLGDIDGEMAEEMDVGVWWKTKRLLRGNQKGMFDRTQSCHSRKYNTQRCKDTLLQDDNEKKCIAMSDDLYHHAH